MSDLFGQEAIDKYSITKSANLNRARVEKNDEFYTLREDIEAEINMYEDGFKGKVVYCNCDPEWSMFPQYLREHQERLGIVEVNSHPGPFQSEESIDLLKRSDMVITNPPFAPFTEFTRQIRSFDKEFLIIGSVMKGGCKTMFELIWAGRARVGYNRVKRFRTPSGAIAGVGCCWYTTLPVKREPVKLEEVYDPAVYPFYDGHPAIDVDKVKRIPIDYDGLMGVPLSFLHQHDPAQFDIVGIPATWGNYPDSTYINGAETAQRIFIKHKWASVEAPPVIEQIDLF